MAGEAEPMPIATPIRLFVARCGATEWDEAGRLQGATDLPLSETGRAALDAEIAGLSKATVGAEISQVLCAADEGSEQTARLLAKRVGGKVKVLPGVAEMNLGLWEGMLRSDFEERYPRAWRQWREDPASVVAPQGESLVEARARIIGALASQIERLKGGTASAVVVRPIAFGLVRCWLGERPTKELWALSRGEEWACWYEAGEDVLGAVPQPTAAG